MIFLTDDETKGFEVGDVDYIHKPFSPAVVKTLVHTHLVFREVREQMARQILDINNELEMAREIQLFILTHEIPETRGLEIAARYVPMSSVADDFYDIIIGDENQCGDSGRARLRARPADFVTLYIPNILPPPPYRFTDRGHRESFSPSGYCRTAQNFRNDKGQNFRNR